MRFSLMTPDLTEMSRPWTAELRWLTWLICRH